MEFDEALDIQTLIIPVTMMNGDKLRDKLLAQRLHIREQLHMFQDIKNMQNKVSAGEGVI